MLAKIAKFSLFIASLLIALTTLQIIYPNQILMAKDEKIQGQVFKLRILHSNDIHAHDEAFSENQKSVGGITRLITLLKELKKQYPQAVVVDAGDLFQGTSLYKKYKGSVEIALLNKANYDLFTIGNHEFDDGPENLQDKLSKANFKIINANLDLSKYPDLEKLVKPYVIIERNGQKVAFIGGITPDLDRVSLTLNGVDLKSKGESWMESISQAIGDVKANGIDKIILVTHIGVEKDRELAENLPDVDAIIGGHSHTRLAKPIMIRRANGTVCPIVQTGCYTRALGNFELAFDSKGQVVESASSYNLIPINSKIQEDLEAKNFVNEKLKPILVLRNDIRGQALGSFDNHFYKYPYDSPLGNLVTAAVLDSGRAHGATIAMQNRGGMRCTIDPGPISLEKIQELLPFNNKVVCATISGKTLRNALEHSISGALGGRFLDLSGLCLVYCPDCPSNHRIQKILIRDSKNKWLPIKDNAKYRVAINDYSFNGGEGYDFKDATDIITTDITIADAFQNYLAKHPRVKPIRTQSIVPVYSKHEIKQKTATGN